MILDASAIVAVLLEEEGHPRLIEAMGTADVLGVGAPTLFETGMVMVGLLDLGGRSLLARFLEEKEVTVVSFDERHWSVATDAFIRYGKGRHPARLNLGDCMTYATAKVADSPLLFVGNDFSQTDVAAA